MDPRDELLRKLVEIRYDAQRRRLRAQHVPRPRRHGGDLPRLLRRTTPSGWSSSATRSTASPRSTPSPARRSGVSTTWPSIPRRHYVTTQEKMERAIAGDRARAGGARGVLRGARQAASRRSASSSARSYDMEMMRELGYCTGIENYSRVISGRARRAPRP